jgi:hypothetical protein
MELYVDADLCVCACVRIRALGGRTADVDRLTSTSALWQVYAGGGIGSSFAIFGAAGVVGVVLILVCG